MTDKVMGGEVAAPEEVVAEEVVVEEVVVAEEAAPREETAAEEATGERVVAVVPEVVVPEVVAGNVVADEVVAEEVLAAAVPPAARFMMLVNKEGGRPLLDTATGHVLKYQGNMWHCNYWQTRIGGRPAGVPVCEWRATTPVHRHAPLSREEFGEVVLNLRCRSLQIASQQFDMEATGVCYDRWKREFFPDGDGQRAPGWDTFVEVAFRKKNLSQKVDGASPRLRDLRNAEDGASAVSPILPQHREAFVEMVENHLLASIRGNERWDFPRIGHPDTPRAPRWDPSEPFPPGKS